MGGTANGGRWEGGIKAALELEMYRGDGGGGGEKGQGWGGGCWREGQCQGAESEIGDKTAGVSVLLENAGMKRQDRSFPP